MLKNMHNKIVHGIFLVGAGGFVSPVFSSETDTQGFGIFANDFVLSDFSQELVGAENLDFRNLSEASDRAESAAGLIDNHAFSLLGHARFGDLLLDYSAEADGSDIIVRVRQRTVSPDGDRNEFNYTYQLSLDADSDHEVTSEENRYGINVLISNARLIESNGREVDVQQRLMIRCETRGRGREKAADIETRLSRWAESG